MLIYAAALALALLAALAARHWLWPTTVPASLRVRRVDPARYFSGAFLARSASYERFLNIDELLAQLAVLAAMVLYAIRGERLTSESAAGPIGTGMLLGMLGFAFIWIAELPFGLAAVWWERRHHVSHQGYAAAVIESFFALGGKFLFVCFALLVAMGLARLTRRWWWALAAPAFAALALSFTFLGVYLTPATEPLRRRDVAADARALARGEGVAGTQVLVQKVARFTSAPNAEAVGFGPTRRVILWDTLLDGRFDRGEIRIVTAHELGHLAHEHPLKRVGWLVLFLIPLAALIAYLTSRRGGMGQPRAVPLALAVFVAAGLVFAPASNLISRRMEAEADFSALRATRQPAAARALFVKLARTSLENPDPPSWAYVLYGDHPTIAQRLAMSEAFAASR